MTSKFMQLFFGLTMVLLPMIGFGTVHLLTGTDTGAGFQPAYITMALAIGFGLFGQVKNHSGFRSFGACLGSAMPRSYYLMGGATLGVVLFSGLGIHLAPVAENDALVWGRFLRQFIQLFIMGCFTVFLVIFLDVSKPNTFSRWQMFSRMLVVGALIQAGYGMLQEIHFFYPLKFFPGLDRVFTSNPSILSGSDMLYLGNAFQNVPRLRGTACEPLYLGNYLLLVWPFVALTGWPKSWRWGITVLLLLLLVLTWSRGAWLGFLFQASILFLLLLRSSRRTAGSWVGSSGKQLAFVGAVIVALGVFVAIVSGWDSFSFPFERMRQAFSTQDWSNLTRLYSMQAAWRGFLLSPVVGVGWGQFAWHFPLLVEPMGLQSQFTWPVVNNYPLQVLCETGFVGFGVFLFSGIFLLKRGLSACRQETTFSRGTISFVAVCGVWLQLFTYSQYNLPHIWVALGALAAVTAYPNKGSFRQGANDD